MKILAKVNLEHKSSKVYVGKGERGFLSACVHGTYEGILNFADSKDGWKYLVIFPNSPDMLLDKTQFEFFKNRLTIFKT